MKKISKEKIVLGIWIGLLVLGNLIWLILDKNPPAWDQAAHLKAVVETNQFLKEQYDGGVIQLIRSFYGYPPLVYFLGGIWSLIVGTGVSQISFLNTFFLIAAIVGVYKLSGNKILPAIIFSLFPVIYDISRNMLLDLALTVWVVWGLYFWIKNNDVGILIMLILASLTKLNGFIYFVPMVVYYLWKSKDSERQFLRLVSGGIIYLLAVGWWWGVNYQNIYLYLTGLAGQGEAATDPMNLLSWQTWIHYFKLFFLNQLGPIAALVFLVTGKKTDKKLIWWTVATYAIFTIIKNKDFRFTMPILPVVAVWWGWGMEEVGRDRLRPVRTVLIGLLLGWMGFNYIENSYNWPLKKQVVVYTPTFLMGNVNWIDFSDYPVREFRRAVWPNEKILTDIPNNEEKLLMVMNVAELNDNTLGFYRLSWGKKNLQIHGIDKWGQMKFDYIVVPEEGVESAPFYDTQLGIRKEAIKQIWGKIDQYEKKAEYTLPSGGKVWLLKVNQ